MKSKVYGNPDMDSVPAVVAWKKAYKKAVAHKKKLMVHESVASAMCKVVIDVHSPVSIGDKVTINNARIGGPPALGGVFFVDQIRLKLKDDNRIDILAGLVYPKSDGTMPKAGYGKHVQHMYSVGILNKADLEQTS